MLARIKRYIRRRLFEAVRASEMEELCDHTDGLLRAMKSCGVGTAFWGRAHITGAAEMEVGRNVHFGDNAFIRAEGGLVIGDNTHISRNLVLYTVNHRINGARIPYDDELAHRHVSIGRNVWVGMNVCIAPGATIGDGAVIGMGAVVSGIVPPMAIVVGQKWRIVGSRDQRHYLQCDENAAYGGPSGVPFTTPK